MSKKIQVKSIVITRGEGPSALCGIPKRASSYEDAELILRGWADTAPSTGGYDKCDFTVTFEDDETYMGTFDLYHPSSNRNMSLKKHIGDYCRFSANLMRPAHFSDESWTRTKIFNAPYAEQYQAFIGSYDV